MKLILCRGIGEPKHSPMLSNVAFELARDGHRFDMVDLPWSAQYGPAPTLFGDDFHDACQQGRALLRSYLDDGPAVVLGYSGGAKLAGDVAAVGHRNLKAVGLISDPAMPPSRVSGRFGITGARPIHNVPVKWVADPKDGICLCPVNSPLRTLADQSESFSLGDPNAWTRRTWAKFMAKQFQPTDPFKQLRDGEWIEAGKLLAGYLSGDHTSYAVRQVNGKTYTHHMADWVGQFL